MSKKFAAIFCFVSAACAAQINTPEVNVTTTTESNVGIGKMPLAGYLLDINGNFRLGTGNSDALLKGVPATGGNFRIGQTSITGKIQFISNADSELLTILNNGRVGIGTSTPTSLFEISSGNGNLTTDGSSLAINRNHTNCGSALAIGNNSEYDWVIKNSLAGCGNRGDLNFINESLDHVLTITQSGNIGIGTTSPTRSLEVVGNSMINDLQVGRYGSALSGNTNPFTVHSYETSDLIFYGSSSATLHVRIYDGDLKFGSASSPSTYIQNNGTAVFAGSVTATSFPTSSDRRLKENVSPLTTYDLRLVTGFQYNLKSDGSLHYGVIAQEVEKIFPHMVSTDEKGMKSVAYNEFIPLLIEAYKELQKQLKSKEETLLQLRGEVNQMKSQNENLESRLSQLEKILSKAKK